MSGHTTSGHTMSGHTMSGHTMTGHTMSGHTMSGHTTSGHTMSGHTTTGHTMSGHTMSGHTTTGHTMNGHTMNGHTMNGHTMSGHTMSGHTMNGHTMNGHTTSGHTMTADFPLDQGVANSTMMLPSFESVSKKTAVQPQLQSVYFDPTDSHYSATPVDGPNFDTMDWDPNAFLHDFDVQLNIPKHKFLIGTSSNSVTACDQANEVVNRQEAQVTDFSGLLDFMSGDSSADTTEFNYILSQENSSETKYVEISEKHTQNTIEDPIGNFSDFDKSQMVEMEFPSNQEPPDTKVQLQEQYTSQQNSGSNCERSDLGSPISSTAQEHIAFVSQVSNVNCEDLKTQSDLGVNIISNEGHGPAVSLYSSSIESRYGGVLGSQATQALTTLNLKDFNSLHSTSGSLESQSHAESEALSESNDGGSYYDIESLTASSPDIPSSVLDLNGSEDQNVGRASNDKKITPTRFLWACLHNPAYNPSLVKWVSKKEGHFEIVKNCKAELAILWGNRSKSKKLTKYEHFSRSIRNHYEKKLKHVEHEGKLECVKGRKLHYRITSMGTL